MSAFFFDSSSLVKRYASETGTKWVFGLVRPATKNRLYLARITGVEVIAALTKRMRMGSLTSAATAKAIKRFEREFTNRYVLVEVSPQIIRTAMDLENPIHFAATMPFNSPPLCKPITIEPQSVEQL